MGVYIGKNWSVSFKAKTFSTRMFVRGTDAKTEKEAENVARIMSANFFLDCDVRRTTEQEDFKLRNAKKKIPTLKGKL